MSVPVQVLPERVWRTYMGGRLLDGRAGQKNAGDTHYPEEWILSTVSAIGPEGKPAGICQAVRDGKTVPFTEFCGHMEVLAKVIDSAERLTIQVHPDKEKAREYFASSYGKTECWHILGKRTEDACIYLGFRPGITKEAWRRYFDTQDVAAMLSCLHRIPVTEGETYWIPGGTPHAIGAGCLLLEIQEPTDYTLRTETVTPGGSRIEERLIHQGIGYEKMFDCFTYEGMTRDDVMARHRIREQDAKREGAAWKCLAGPPRIDCFSLLYREETTCLPMAGNGRSFGLYVWEGRGHLECGGGSWELRPGSQLFIPEDCERFVIQAEETMKIFRIEGPCR